MTQAVMQDDARAARAIEAALCVTVADPFRGLVITEGDALAAALVFNNFDHQNIDLTISVEKSIGPRAIRDIARYVFGRLAVKRVTCVTLATNQRAIERLENLGFGFEGRMRQRFPQGDGLIFSLLASEQKFVRKFDEFAKGSRSLRDGERANAVKSTDCELPIDA